MKNHVGAYSLLDHIEFRMGRVIAASDVAMAMPTPPPGWEVRKALSEDSLRIRGRQVAAEKLAAMAKLDDKFAAIPGYQTENRLYQKGAGKVFLSISFVPANVKGAVPVMGLMQVMLIIDASSEDVHSQVHSQGEGSKPFRKYIGPNLGNFAIYSAPLDWQIFISALCTASESDTLGFAFEY